MAASPEGTKECGTVDRREYTYSLASGEIPDAFRASGWIPHGGRGIEPFLRSA
jgi:hypothetical protein